MAATLINLSESDKSLPADEFSLYLFSVPMVVTSFINVIHYMKSRRQSKTFSFNILLQ